MIAARTVTCPIAGLGGGKQKACPVLPRSSNVQRARTTCSCWAYHESLLPSSRFTESAQILSSNDFTDFDDPRNGVLPGGHTLSWNKKCLNDQMQAHGLSEDRKHLLMAMAMQETNHLDWRERDASKDISSDKSRNATCFNLGQDLIEKSGWFAGNPGQYKDMTYDEWQLLNSDAGLYHAVGILKFAIQVWKVEDTLAFVRHGGTAFDPTDQTNPRPANADGWWRQYVDSKPYDDQYRQQVKDKVTEFFGCIKLMLHCIDNDPNLMTNNMRPGVKCSHI